MITPALQDEVERQLKQKIATISPLSAANTAQIYRITTEQKKVFVAKVAEKDMDTEAFMLQFLKEKTKLPVPGVYYSNEHVIIMEFIDTHYALNEASHRHAAELLGELHKIHSDKYGFERDTLVASLKQPNPQSKDWVQFFAQHRLLYMAGEALKEKKIDAALMKKLEKLAGKLSKYITSPNPPSLIHGDVWGGNVLPGRDRVAAFLDPAIYYADPEIELAFIHLLGTFGGSFFTHYADINPIKPGFFEERAYIYSLYPLLVHTRLFGVSYARKVQKIVEKFS